MNNHDVDVTENSAEIYFNQFSPMRKPNDQISLKITKVFENELKKHMRKKLKKKKEKKSRRLRSYSS